MSKEQVIKHIEETIKLAKLDIKRNGCTSDKVRQLSGLVNSYSRLLCLSDVDVTDDGCGDPSYYDRMASEQFCDTDALSN